MDPPLDPIATTAIARTPARLVPRLAAQRARDGLRDPGVQGHALLGGGPFSLTLELVEQPQGHPSDVTVGVTESAGLAGRRRTLRPRIGGMDPTSTRAGIGWSAHRDPHVTAVQAHLHHPVIQRRGDFCGEVGQCIHDGQAGRGSERRAQHGCGVAGLLVARRRGGGEVFAQL